MTNYQVNGFKAAAVAAGIKKDGGLDFALIYSENMAVGAGLFTKNRVTAAPVTLSRENILDGKVRAIVVNSGNANACNGRVGLDDAYRTAGLVSEELDISPDEVLVASTGVIGMPLNMDLLTRAMPELVKGLSPEGIPLAAEAIMTTDSFPKISHYDGIADGKTYRILGIAKGAGMIMPDMATMLCFILSDIHMDSTELKRALSSSIESTFNRISVDGDTSTNDMVAVMANGLAGNGRVSPAEFEGFKHGLQQVMSELATMIVRDGEGATKLIQVVVRGAASEVDALAAARTIANSSLVKTAFFGQDPNWGRIMAALGRSGIHMTEEDVDIWIDDVQIVKGGIGKGGQREKEAAERMAQKEFSLIVDLHQGELEDRMMTCDLTHEYITINAEYRT